MNIITENFQSLKGINNFEFNEGINIIIGPNGSGKSSLFYAIENCLDNPSGVDDCINHDANNTKVTINNNDESITWVREKGSSSYINNKDGNTYVKASKLNSLNLADLGFYFDKKGKIMNIHNEWSTLFPFGESDNDMFRLFEDIFNISCSFDILDNIKKDSQEIKAEVKHLKQQQESQNNRLNQLNEIASNVNIIDINNIIEGYLTFCQSLQTLKQDYEIYNINCPYDRVILPSGFDITSLYTSESQFEKISEDLESYSRDLEFKNVEMALSPFNIEIIDNSELKKDYQDYQDLRNLLLGYDSELNLLKSEYDNIDKEIQKIKVCPTCGRPL